MSGTEDIPLREIRDQVVRLEQSVHQERETLRSVKSAVDTKPSQAFVFGTVTATFSLIAAIFWFPFSSLIDSRFEASNETRKVAEDALSDQIDRNADQITKLTDQVNKLVVELELQNRTGSTNSDELTRILSILDGRVRAVMSGASLIEYNGDFNEYIASDRELTIFSVLFRFSQFQRFDEETLAGTTFTLFAPTDQAFRSVDSEYIGRLSSNRQSFDKERFWKTHLQVGLIPVNEFEQAPGQTSDLVVTADFVYQRIPQGLLTVASVERIVETYNGNIVVVDEVIGVEIDR